MKHRFQVPIFWLSAAQMFSYSSFSLGVRESHYLSQLCEVPDAV